MVLYVTLWVKSVIAEFLLIPNLLTYALSHLYGCVG